MAKFPMLRVIVCIALGYGFYSAAKGIELIGDLAPERSERLQFHLTALVVLLVSLACWLGALRMIWRFMRGAAAPARRSPEQVREVFASPDASASFDPDAALENYLAKREAVAPVVPPARGFGRKPV